jgi:tetratricopeptide (TPR) repeat protein
MSGDRKVRFADQLAAALRDPDLVRAGAALQANQLHIAEQTLRAYLRARPQNVAAIRMLAEVAGRLGRYPDAEQLLRRALDLAPEFSAARANLVFVLQRQSKFTEAHQHADRLLAEHPEDPAFLATKASVLARTGGYAEAITAYESILRRKPDQSRLWVSYGHVLKTVGRQADSVQAYRRAIAVAPGFGDAWWSLANLKTVRLDSADIRAMQDALKSANNASDRYHLHFALGKALEDAGDFQASFSHYAEGNRLRRAELPYDPDETSLHLKRCKALLGSAEFATRSGAGDPAADPIFVVGLPRAGSTLVEQILGSHSLVEGTMELPDITSISTDLNGRNSIGRDRTEHGGYLPRLLALSPDELGALGRRYIEGTRIQRKTSKPYFIDKMPNNFAHIGLIAMILPNAKIIDVRRAAMANCFSAYKQHFSRGQGFTYDLAELGRYYRDYVSLMDHYDSVLPRRIYRLCYEDLVAQPETVVRSLLDYCGLGFEESCLQFYDNPRAVRTASSEQVRRPITSEGVDSWKRFEPWLSALRESLGDLS